MKNTFLLAIICLLITIKGNCQLTKGNFLIGGNASFSSTKFKNTLTSNYTLTELNISPNIGYFFADKFAFGIRPGYSLTRNNFGNTKSTFENFLIGPFARYYFLEKDKRINILSEISYQNITTKSPGNAKTNINGFSFLLGPVLYFNSSVGMEFTLGYSTAKYSKELSNNSLQVGIGLQIHLEK